MDRPGARVRCTPGAVGRPGISGRSSVIVGFALLRAKAIRPAVHRGRATPPSARLSVTSAGGARGRHVAALHSQTRGSPVVCSVKTPAHLTRQWLTLSQEDLAVAERLLAKPPLTGGAVFHAQQAAERALKGLLAWHAPDGVSRFGWTLDGSVRFPLPCWWSALFGKRPRTRRYFRRQLGLPGGSLAGSRCGAAR
jgi:hypothetical protein